MDEEWSSDEDGFAEGETNEFHRDPSYTLVIIDTHPNMFETNDKGLSTFKVALEACYSILDSLLLESHGSSQKSNIAICLVHNDSDKQKLADFDDCPLQVLKILKKLMAKDDIDLEEQFQASGKFDLSGFLINARTKLNTINTNIFEKFVIFITNDDKPVGNIAVDKIKATDQAEHYVQAKIGFHVITMSDRFNMLPFYKEFLTLVQGKQVVCVSDVEEMADEISAFIKIRYTTVSIKFYPFKGKSDKYINTKVHNYISSREIISNGDVLRTTHEEVIQAKDSSEAATNYNYKLQVSETMDPLVFTPEEKDQIKETQDIPVGISLLYTTGDELIDKELIFKSPYLISKDSKECESIYDIIWQYCWTRNKTLVCLQKNRKGGPILYVQLFAKCVNKQKMFLAKAFPSNDSMEFLFEPEQVEEPNDVVFKGLERIIDKLTFKYDVESFPDVVDEKCKAYIKSEMLEEGMKAVKDVYDEASIEAKVCSEAARFRKLYDMPIESSKRPSTTRKPRVKAPKRECTEEEED